MRLNFTGRQKIEKNEARVSFNDDPVGSRAGYYFDLDLDLSRHNLPLDARIFVEASRGLVLMRFDLGTVGSRTSLSPAQRRLSEFGKNPDGVKLRVKVDQPDGPQAGKLLAEADNLSAGGGGGVFPLIELAGMDLGSTPFRLVHIPSDAALPTLYINTDLDGKAYASDPIAKPLLMTAAVREIFANLVREGDDHEDDDEHWANLWTRFAKQVLGLDDPPNPAADDYKICDWLDQAVEAFAEKHTLVKGLVNEILNNKAGLEQADLNSLEGIS